MSVIDGQNWLLNSTLHVCMRGNNFHYIMYIHSSSVELQRELFKNVETHVLY